MPTALRRITPSLKNAPSLTASRVTLGGLKLCYILVANKKIQYANGRSRIVYIGTTKDGVNRVAGSVAFRAKKILRHWGITSFEARIVTCRPRRKVRTWLRLEGSFITAFQEKYGDRPKCNSRNGKADWMLFRRQKIDTIIEDLS